VAASSRPPLSATTSHRVRGPVPLASRRWFKLTQRVLGRDWPTAYLFIALVLFLLGIRRMTESVASSTGDGVHGLSR
jgi:hypothetical protein